jgi:phosphoserine aminotransferase
MLEIGVMGQDYNFSAGPVVLPQVALRAIPQEQWDRHGLKRGHCGKAFVCDIAEAEKAHRALWPTHYKVRCLQAARHTPTMPPYPTFAQTLSPYHPSAPFALYIKWLFRWLKSQKALKTIAALNQEKSRFLYGTIDQSDQFDQPVFTRPYHLPRNVILSNAMDK